MRLVGLALLMVAMFSWGAFTIRDRVFPYTLIDTVVRSGVVPFLRSRTADGLTPSQARIDSFALNVRQVDLVFVGDSRVAGFEWQDAFAGLRVANRGVNGDTVAGIRARLDGILATGASHAVLMAGLNDFARGRPREDVWNDYRMVMETLTAGGMTPVPVATLSCRFDGCPLQDIAWLNARLEAYAAQVAVPFLDPRPALNDASGQFLPGLSYDGVHLTRDGYAAWLGVLVPALSGLQ